MKPSEVIQRIPGLTGNNLYNWQRRGFFSAHITHKGKRTWREYDEETVHLIALMVRFCRDGFPPRIAYQKASAFNGEQDKTKATQQYESYNENELTPKTILKDRILDILYSSSKTFREKIYEAKRILHQKSGDLVFSLAFPGQKGRDKLRDTLRNEVFSDMQINIAPCNLELLARSCLSILDENVNTVVGISINMMVALGSISLFAYQKYRTSLYSLVLDMAGGKPKLLGGEKPKEMRIAIVTDTVCDTSSILEAMAIIELMGHKIIQLLCIVEPHKSRDIEALKEKGIKVSYMFTRDDILNLAELDKTRQEDGE